jgi:adenine phosphoribosyltransferase
MGIPVSSILCNELNIPLTIVRKRSYGLSGELEVTQQTGYSKSKLFINGINDSDTIILVDDVLSTGNTMLSVIQTLQSINVTIKGVFIVIDKGDKAKDIFENTGVPVHSLIQILIKDKQVVIL